MKAPTMEVMEMTNALAELAMMLLVRSDDGLDYIEMAVSRAIDSLTEEDVDVEEAEPQLRLLH